MILVFLTKCRDYRARVHTGPGGDTRTSYIMGHPTIYFSEASAWTSTYLFPSVLFHTFIEQNETAFKIVHREGGSNPN